MKKERKKKMNLPHVAVSWETFLLLAAGSFALGALFSAAALGRGRGRGAGGESRGEGAPRRVGSPAGEAGGTPGGPERLPEAEPPETVSSLAARLWLAETPAGAEAGPALADPGEAPEPRFGREETAAFWREEIAPFRDVLERTGELRIIEKTLSELDREGDCPSVVSGDGIGKFRPTASRFGKISLLDHSLRAARHMRRIHDARHGERLLYGKHALAALAHDVGKMEKYRKPGRYVKDAHAEASAAVLSEWIAEFGGKSAPREMQGVVDAVRNHHRNAPEAGELLLCLRKADRAAREEEFSGGRPGAGSSGGDAPRGEPPAWLEEDVPRILEERVAPAINVAGGEGEPLVWAFSTTGGVVYVDPHRLLDRVREHMEAEEVADMRFFDSSAELEAKLMVTNALKSRGWVGGEVKDGYYAAFWNYERGGKKSGKAGFWIPVFAEAFGGDLAEFESRKTAEVRVPASVSPRAGGGKGK